MAGNKYLERNSSTGIVTEVSAVQTSAGAGDAGKVIALDAAGKLATNMLPSGIGAEQVQVTWAEGVAANDLINVYLDGATWKGRKADGGTNKYRADGFAIASGEAAATGYVQMEGLITGLTGLSQGKLYLNNTTAGTYQQTVPTGTGKLHQVVGRAISDSSYFFQSEEEIVLA